ncbi:hypothetical protein BC834DRAFT_974112 [Gloeopeniophorella convolvens]|nr:hypothetical protein BC834DRAFT_974112 [Gloeopeniophorella convolvens]
MARIVTRSQLQRQGGELPTVIEPAPQQARKASRVKPPSKALKAAGKRGRGEGVLQRQGPKNAARDCSTSGLSSPPPESPASRLLPLPSALPVSPDPDAAHACEGNGLATGAAPVAEPVEEGIRKTPPADVPPPADAPPLDTGSNTLVPDASSAHALHPAEPLGVVTSLQDEALVESHCGQESGRISTEASLVMEEGFKQADLVLHQIAEKTNFPFSRVLKNYVRKRLQKAPGDNCWNSYQAYYAANKEIEHRRLSSAELEGAEAESHSSDTDADGEDGFKETPPKQSLSLIKLSYQRFKEEHPETFKKILETWDELTALQNKSRETVGKRSVEFSKLISVCKDAVSQGSRHRQFEAVLMFVGGIVNSDGGLAEVYETEGAKGFIKDRFRMSHDEAIGHLKAQVYDSNSTKRIEDLYGPKSFETGDESEGVAASNREASQPAARRKRGASPTRLTRPTKRPRASSKEAKCHPHEDLRQVLFELWRKAIPAGSTRRAELPKFPWKNLSIALSKNHLQMLNYPEDVPFPSEGQKKGINSLTVKQVDLMMKQIRDREHPLHFVSLESSDIDTRMASMVGKSLPVIIGAPLPPTSNCDKGPLLGNPDVSPEDENNTVESTSSDSDSSEEPTSDGDGEDLTLGVGLGAVIQTAVTPGSTLDLNRLRNKPSKPITPQHRFNLQQPETPSPHPRPRGGSPEVPEKRHREVKVPLPRRLKMSSTRTTVDKDSEVVVLSPSSSSPAEAPTPAGIDTPENFVRGNLQPGLSKSPSKGKQKEIPLDSGHAAKLDPSPGFLTPDQTVNAPPKFPTPGQETPRQPRSPEVSAAGDVAPLSDQRRSQAGAVPSIAHPVAAAPQAPEPGAPYLFPSNTIQPSQPHYLPPQMPTPGQEAPRQPHLPGALVAEGIAPPSDQRQPQAGAAPSVVHPVAAAPQAPQPGAPYFFPPNAIQPSQPYYLPPQMPMPGQEAPRQPHLPEGLVAGDVGLLLDQRQPQAGAAPSVVHPMATAPQALQSGGPYLLPSNATQPGQAYYFPPQVAAQMATLPQFAFTQPNTNAEGDYYLVDAKTFNRVNPYGVPGNSTYQASPFTNAVAGPPQRFADTGATGMLGLGAHAGSYGNIPVNRLPGGPGPRSAMVPDSSTLASARAPHEHNFQRPVENYEHFQAHAALIDGRNDAAASLAAAMQGGPGSDPSVLPNAARQGLVPPPQTHLPTPATWEDQTGREMQAKAGFQEPRRLEQGFPM